MYITKKDEELLLTVLSSYAAHLTFQDWDNQAAKLKRLEQVNELSRRIYNYHTDRLNGRSCKQ